MDFPGNKISLVLSKDQKKEVKTMLKAVQKIRVEWSHCDPAGIIFNPHYYIWMDQGTHRIFEAAGFDMPKEIGTNNFKGLPLVTSGATFIKPVRYGDTIELFSTITKFGNKSFRMEHSFMFENAEVANGFEVRVWGNDDGQGGMVGAPFPEKIKRLFDREETLDTTTMI